MNNKYNNLKKTKKKITGGMSGILIGVLLALPIIVALTVWYITTREQTKYDMIKETYENVSEVINNIIDTIKISSKQNTI